MRVIQTVREMIDFRENQKNRKSGSIGFVPTMGALHKGHLKLVEQSKKNTDITIVSIFVNPKQFNDKNDFDKYPRTFAEDINKLEEINCDVVFMPQNDDIYNNYKGYSIDLGHLNNICEGEYRPGHFKGVVDIVYRLFDIIKPDKAFFGEKDYQQLLVIKKMTEKAKFKTKIVPVPTVREKNGLAMSSRNKNLSEKQFETVGNIYKILNQIETKSIINLKPETVEKEIIEKINKIDGLEIEYVKFCEPNSLKLVKYFVEGMSVIVCIAVFCGKVRLIDNKVLHF